MSKEKRDLTQGNLWKQVLLFSVPLMLSNLLQVLFNIMDIAVVGRFAGSIALGAVGSTTTLITLFTGILLGLACGINVLVAQAIGAKNDKTVKETVHTAALISLITGAILLVAGMIFVPWILSLLRTKTELMPGAVSYMRIYLLGMPALALYNYGNAVFSASGDTKRPLMYLSLAGVLNVILNLVLVIIFHLDVQGVAIASVIAQYTSGTLIIRDLFRSRENFGISIKDMKLTKTQVGRILQLGGPAAFQYVIFCIANLFVQSGVNSFQATVVAGNAAAANADNLIYDIMAAFYTACGSFMGQNFGAGKKARVWKSYLICLAYSFGIALILGGALVFCGRGFLSLFTKDPEVVAAGMERLTIMGFSYCVSAFMDCTMAAARGLGKTFVPTIIVILGSCIFRVAWIYTIFAYYQTTTALYLLYVFSWTITAVAQIIYFVHIYRRTVK